MFDFICVYVCVSTVSSLNLLVINIFISWNFSSPNFSDGNLGDSRTDKFFSNLLFVLLCADW